MKLLNIMLLLSVFSFIYAKEQPLTINFKDLSVEQLIHLTSKYSHKNILMTQPLEGSVDFVSHQAIYKKDLMEILALVLDAKGYTMVESHNILTVVKKEKSNSDELILKENKNLQDERIIAVIPLKNIEVKSVMAILSEMVMKKKYVNENVKPFISKDEESNRLIVVGIKSEIQMIQHLIKELDKERLQVYVQARIIELSENRTKNIGLKYGLTSINSNGNNIFTLGSNLGGSVNTLNTEALSLFSIATPTLKSGIALGATLNLLKNNQAIDIISEPSILCVNNKESSIYVGETKSFQTGSSITDGGTTNNSFQREDIGLTLKVRPRISSEKKVILDIQTILEDARELKTGQINPDTTKKEVKTTAIVSNGESVILGGLIKSKKDSTEDKIPFLGDIPILGHLFKNNRESKDKINLVVIMTPYIIPQSKDLTFIREQLLQLKMLEEQYSKDLEAKLEKKVSDEKVLESKNEYTTHEKLNQQRHKEVLKTFGIY
ncbi:MAG: type II secretion system protein GspD [Candidatus Marinarcus sp.]|uniref:type II secretion system protein GspD n=1 Tax=Candidatus Marinarcus sp. TaxID=3100987 RepID=UPI003AFFBF7B